MWDRILQVTGGLEPQTACVDSLPAKPRPPPSWRDNPAGETGPGGNYGVFVGHMLWAWCWRKSEDEVKAGKPVGAS